MAAEAGCVMPRRRELIIVDLEKARARLRSGEFENVWVDIDKLLDERLEELGAHPADCSCEACVRRVYEVLNGRSLGECSDARDVADPAEWGGAGVNGDTTGP